ncbi:MAG: ABC transporter substrate-binding protein [Planctomycetota bacterium]
MRRIVSLLPATTEIVMRLGAGDRLMGASHECRVGSEVPRLTWSNVRTAEDGASGGEIDAEVRDVLGRGEPIFGFDAERFAALEPDVVLTQSLCNVCALDGSVVQRAVRELQGADGLGEPVRLLEYAPTTLAEIAAGLEAIGAAIGEAEAGQREAAAMRRRLDAVATSVAGRPRVDVVFLEWLEPLFGCGHWLPEMVEIAGGRELIGQAGARSRTVSAEAVLAADPEVLLVCCCGWPAERTERAWRRFLDGDARLGRMRAVQSGRVHVLGAADGLTEPGPGLAEDCVRLAALIQGAAWSNRCWASERRPRVAEQRFPD